MALALNDQQVTQFHDAGFVSPFNVLSAEEVAKYRTLLEDFERQQGGPVSGAERSKCHLLFKWVDDLMRDDRLVDLVEDLIGGNILCWNSLFWIKEAGSRSFVSWHQDARYWGLTTKQLVTVWVALSPASVEAGCMRVLPGSHRGELLAHRDEYHEDNLLTRGQRVEAIVDENLAVPMPLEPGQVSLHNVCLAHASGPNTTDDRRIGLSFHYMPTDSRQTVVPWDSAALVSGRDEFQNFTHTPRPTEDFELSAVEFHRKASDVVREVVFKDAASTRGTL